MSFAAERAGGPELPRQWERLERVAEEVAVTVGTWRRRALEAEEEVTRLRHALEELAAEREQPGDLEEELRRLRAENAALHSRMLQGRKRVTALLRRLASLGIEP